MMCNDVALAGAAKWKMLPTKLALPSQLPPSLQCHGSAWEITGEPQSIIKSAVMEGIFLTVFYLTEIQKILQFPLPDKGSGSGKKGGVTKPDYAEGLVQFLWPDESSESKKRMYDAIMGGSLSRVKCANDVIQAVKELGAEAERDFADIHQVALNQELVEKERKLRAPTELREEQKTFTPSTLKSLLPDVPLVACNRNPILCRYQVFYPGSLDCFLGIWYVLLPMFLMFLWYTKLLHVLGDLMRLYPRHPKTKSGSAKLLVSIAPEDQLQDSWIRKLPLGAV